MKILIVKRDKLGDMIVTTPMLRLLRTALPDAQIHLLAAEYNLWVVDGNACIDRRWSFGRVRTGRKVNVGAAIGQLKLYLDLKREKFDFAIAAGGVGLAQINTNEVQARVSSSCPLATYLRGINPDGSALCSDLPGVTTITTVDNPANQVGQGTDIAIGLDGLPVISYFDEVAESLKVAKCANSACTAATVTAVSASIFPFAVRTSIAVGQDGLPMILSLIHISEPTRPY